MFSGLIRDIGKIHSFRANKLKILSTYQPNIGDSIAVNGVCLTAMESSPTSFVVELSETTKQTIVLESFIRGANVHLEPALRADSRLDGHIVQGHIDGIGVIQNINHQPTQSEFFIATSSHTMRTILPKGSICVDGVSLTIVDTTQEGFWLTIIPHTLQTTLFKSYKISQRVNLETDMFVRNTIALINTQNLSTQSKKVSWVDVDAIQLTF